MSLLDDVPGWVWWALSAFSLVLLVGSMFALRALIIRMPRDYLMGNQRDDRWLGVDPARQLLARLLRNAFGVLLMTLGGIMLFTPGQGVLLLVVGLSLVDVPGKHTLLRRVVGRPRVKRMIDSIRRRHGRPPIEV